MTTAPPPEGASTEPGAPPWQPALDRLVESLRKRKPPSWLADYGGEHPTFVIDLPLVAAEDREPPHIQPGYRPPSVDRERKVLGYARVRTAMTFHVGKGVLQDLPAGRVIELIEPNDYESSELEHWEAKHQQHVVVRWANGVCLVLGRDIERVHADAWREQG